MSPSAKAAGWGALTCLPLFLLATCAALLGEGHWWALPAFLLAMASGVLSVVLVLVWGVAWVRESGAPGGS